MATHTSYESYESREKYGGSGFPKDHSISMLEGKTLREVIKSTLPHAISGGPPIFSQNIHFFHHQCVQGGLEQFFVGILQTLEHLHIGGILLLTWCQFQKGHFSLLFLHFQN